MCLDNDNAGVAAVERLCTGPNPILKSIMEESNIEIFVASLPDTVKDPAEFLEENSEEEGLDEKFRAEVIDKAQEWTRWYMNTLVNAHDPVSTNNTAEEDGGFGKVFDNVASFLSVFESVDERMKKASIITSKLTSRMDAEREKVDGDSNHTEASITTRIQLASNLVEKAGNMAHSKSMNSQRTYEFASRSRRNDRFLPNSLEIGQDVTLQEGTSITTNRTKSRPKPPPLEPQGEDRSSRRQPNPPQGTRRRQRARVKRRTTTNRIPKSMTKHVGGVAADPFDDEWLGVTEDKVCFYPTF